MRPSVLDDLPDRPGFLVRGNIDLPYDYREIPTIERVGSQPVTSFALAAASLVDRSLLSQFQPDDFPYALTFIAPEDFPQVSYREGPQFPSGDDCSKMRHKIVVVGGAWHGNGYENGEVVDLRDATPMGSNVNAIYLHANYIEALLEGRARTLLPAAVAAVVEILASLWIALILAGTAGSPHLGASPGPARQAAVVRPRLLGRLRGYFAEHPRLRGYLAAIAISLALLFVTYVFAQNLGLYTEFFFPALFLFGHAFWDHWRELLRMEHELRIARTRLDAVETQLAECRQAGGSSNMVPER